MKKSLLFFIILASSIIAQFSNADKMLAEATFQRNYTHPIFDEYFKSDSPDKIRALLLSVSHSEDTSFVKDIIKLDFDKFGNYIAFALGQLGKCKTSTDYLFQKLFVDQKLLFEEECFKAIGKTGFDSTLTKIIGSYYDKRKNRFEGISYAIVDFFNRGIKNEAVYNIIRDELKNYYSTSSSKFEALYALYRIGPKSEFTDILANILREEDNRLNIRLKSYALGCFQKLKTVPASLNFSDALLNNNSWEIRVQAAKALIYSSFDNEEDIEKYLRNVTDPNPNVSVQFANSIREIEVQDSLYGSLISLIEKYLNVYSINTNTKGELFNSLCYIDKKNTFNYVEKYKNDLQRDFQISVLNYNSENPKLNFEKLLEYRQNSSQKDLLEIMGAAIPLQNQLIDDKIYSEFILTELNSDYPAVISITANGLDSLFLFNNEPRVKSIIQEQLFKHLNNPEYMESLMSLGNLAAKIDPEFETIVLDKLSSSNLYSIKRFSARKTGSKNEFKKPLNNFEELWNEAFNYIGALVKTNKGSFIIKFNQGFAPISCGNFIALAQKGFYNNVIFHRVVPNFVIQTGDESGTGWGGPGYEIVSECSMEPFNKGYVGMASAGKDTEGSQWFVMHSDHPHLNGRYTNFGRIVDGKEIVDIIDRNDIILEVELIK